MDIDNCTSWLEIDLRAIRNNIQQLLQISKTNVMAVVKANGYGHGMEQVARAAVQAGATWCGLARLEEAIQLHQSDVNCNLLVMGHTRPSFIQEAIARQIHVAVFDEQSAQAYAAQAQAMGIPLHIHVKIDSGMGRLGIFPEEGVPFIRWLHTLTGLEIDGVFTHFARADEPSLPTTDQQLDRFCKVVQTLEQSGLRPKWVHAANSAATIYYPRARFDLIRAGVATYGLHPSKDAMLPDTFRPAMTWKTRLTSVKHLPAGHGVSYTHRYITSKRELIGATAIGYADGFRRRLGNFALVHGKRVPVVGTVCMDQCMLQLDSVPEAKVGDEVVLIGQQGDDRITIEEVAEAWGTINYDVGTGQAARVPRFYIE